MKYTGGTGTKYVGYRNERMATERITLHTCVGLGKKEQRICTVFVLLDVKFPIPRPEKFGRRFGLALLIFHTGCKFMPRTTL